MMKSKSRILLMTASIGGLLALAGGLIAQQPTFRVKVDMVVLSFTVTDGRGRYINGLKPGDFRILEDGITQRLTTFS